MKVIYSKEIAVFLIWGRHHSVIAFYVCFIIVFIKNYINSAIVIIKFLFLLLLVLFLIFCITLSLLASISSDFDLNKALYWDSFCLELDSHFESNARCDHSSWIFEEVIEHSTYFEKSKIKKSNLIKTSIHNYWLRKSQGIVCIWKGLKGHLWGLCTALSKDHLLSLCSYFLWTQSKEK